MFDVFSRSWKLTKLSWSVLLADKEMLLFPLIGGIFSFLYILVLIYPTILVGFIEGGSNAEIGALGYVLLFVTYLGLSFIATFFNVCTVYTTKVRFEGGDATFMESIRFGFSKIGLIFAWAMVSATVGMILRGIEYLARRVGGIGEIVIRILTSLLGMAWAIVTLFVIPAMVYEDVGPVDAIKLSFETLKKTWGESLIRHYGLGLVQSAFIFLGVLVFIALLIAVSSSGVGMVVVLVLAALYFVSVVLVFTVMNSVFNTALFVYAETGQVPGEFDEDVLNSAFRQK